MHDFSTKHTKIATKNYLDMNGTVNRSTSVYPFIIIFGNARVLNSSASIMPFSFVNVNCPASKSAQLLEIQSNAHTFLNTHPFKRYDPSSALMASQLSFSDALCGGLLYTSMLLAPAGMYTTLLYPWLPVVALK